MLLLRMRAMLPRLHGALGSRYQSTGAASPPDTSTSASTSNSEVTEGNGALNKLIVFGGRGFVGSAIVQEAVEQGLQVVSVSRSGTPPVQRHSWMESVQWVRGNALEPRTYEALLPGALAAISCVGAFGSQEHMLQTNGVANVAAIEAAAQAGIPRFVFISAAIPNIPGLEYLLGGYVNGKRMAEEALQSHYPQGGVALRPGAIYGNRVISSSLTLPLQYVFQPLEALLAHLPSRQLSQLPLLGAALTPPVPVQAVARAAVKAATDSNVAPGILDVWDIQQYK